MKKLSTAITESFQVNEGKKATADDHKKLITLLDKHKLWNELYTISPEFEDLSTSNPSAADKMRIVKEISKHDTNPGGFYFDDIADIVINENKSISEADSTNETALKDLRKYLMKQIKSDAKLKGSSFKPVNWVKGSFIIDTWGSGDNDRKASQYATKWATDQIKKYSDSKYTFVVDEGETMFELEISAKTK